MATLREPATIAQVQRFLADLPARDTVLLTLHKKTFEAVPLVFVPSLAQALSQLIGAPAEQTEAYLGTGKKVYLRLKNNQVEVGQGGQGPLFSVPLPMLVEELTQTFAECKETCEKLATTPFTKALINAELAALDGLKQLKVHSLRFVGQTLAPLKLDLSQAKTPRDCYRLVVGSDCPAATAKASPYGAFGLSNGPTPTSAIDVSPTRRLVDELTLVSASHTPIFYLSLFDTRLRYVFGSKQQ